MLKRLILFLLLCAVAVSVSAREGHDEDWFVGLHSFNDGLYDVAKLSLLDYLDAAPKKDKNIGFAHYLLYKIYLLENNYTDAAQHLAQAEKVKDSRIDKTALASDKMTILTRTSCEKGAAYLLENPKDPLALAYLNSPCPVEKPLITLFTEKPFSSAVRMKAIQSVEKVPEYVKSLYAAMKAETLSANEYGYLGILFAKLEQFDEFWDIYGKYRNDAMVRVALDRLWNLESYDRYTDTFEKNRKSYKLESVDFCRAIKSYEKTEKKYDCDLLDSCLPKKDLNFYQAKISCIAENQNAEKVLVFTKKIPKKYDKALCNVTGWLIEKNRYSTALIERSASCEQAPEFAKLLYNKKDIDTVLTITKDSENDRMNYYRALVLAEKGEKVLATTLVKKIKDKELKDQLRSLLKQ